MSQVPPPNSRKFQIITAPPRIHRRKNDFARSFRIVYIVSRVFGLMPFTVAYNMNGEIEKPTFTKPDVLWFLISICVYSFGIFTQLQFMFPSDLEHYTSPLVVLSDSVIIMLGLILAFLAIFSDMCHRSKLVDIAKRFITFDKKVIKICKYFIHI